MSTNAPHASTSRAPHATDTSAGDYPLPAYAGYIWHTGSALVLQLPGGHSVTLPIERLQVGKEAEQRGWIVLLEVLNARRNGYNEAQRPLTGSSEAPTRSQVEALLNGKRAQAFDSLGRPKLTASDMGWED